MINKGPGRACGCSGKGIASLLRLTLSLLDRLCCLTLVLSKAGTIGSEDDDVCSLIIIVQDTTELKVSPGVLCVALCSCAPAEDGGSPAWATAHRLHRTRDQNKTQHAYAGPGRGPDVLRGKTCLSITSPDLTP